MLSNQEEYKQIQKDPTQAIERKTNDIIANWKNMGYIDQKTSKQLRTYNSNTVKLIGIPKIKNNKINIRPIINTRNGPTYKLAKYPNEILRKIAIKDEAIIRNIVQFKKEIENIEME